jgi:hypothetical protein
MRLSLCLPLVAALAAPALAQPAERSLAAACPSLTPKEIAGMENYKGQFAENAPTRGLIASA